MTVREGGAANNDVLADRAFYGEAAMINAWRDVFDHHTPSAGVDVRTRLNHSARLLLI